MAEIEAHGVGYRYGKIEALRDVDLEVPEGSICAMLGPNGAGKTTLLQVVMGLRRPESGRVALMGKEPVRLSAAERAVVGYVAESQRLPKWMKLGELERYLAPLYPGWDDGLADALRRRFDLDPSRRIGTLSRGEYMKAAVLCALAPRPRVLVMDEPFTGMDALVKDELVRALLEFAGQGEWTVLVSSHDIGELEPLADRVGILVGGRLVLSAEMDAVRESYRRVEVVGGNGVEPPPEAGSLSVQRSGPRTTFLMAGGRTAEAEVRGWFPDAARVTVRPASLRDVFIGVARAGAAGGGSREEEAL